MSRTPTHCTSVPAGWQSADDAGPFGPVFNSISDLWAAQKAEKARLAAATRDKLANAFRFHRSQRFYPAILNDRLSMRTASAALTFARLDVEAGKARYCASPWSRPETSCPQGEPRARRAGTWANPFPPKPERIVFIPDSILAGLRHVGDVEAESHGGRDSFSRRDTCGWFTDPHGDVFKDGTGLCYGVVYQLPATRDGRSRFIAGHRFGGHGDGATFDLARVYVGEAGAWPGDAQSDDAAREAARAADSSAEAAAKRERDYQTAWAAGSRFSDLGAEVAFARREALALMADLRRKPGLREEVHTGGRSRAGDALRESIFGRLDAIREAREKRAKLQAGDAGDLPFYPSPENVAAFNEGAGL